MPELRATLWNAFDSVYDQSDCAITYACDCMNEASISRATLDILSLKQILPLVRWSIAVVYLMKAIFAKVCAVAVVTG